MKRIVIIIATVLSASVMFAQSDSYVKVASVGSMPKPKPSVKKAGEADAIPEFDRKTKMLISEPQYECLYNYVINNTNSGDTIPEVTSCVLQIGTDMSRFSDYTTFLVDSATHCLGADDYIKYKTSKDEWTNLYAFDEIIYQNFPSGKMTVYGMIVPNCYVYEEDTNPIEWEITEKTDTVCGYQCMMAEGSYGGRTWRAWFTAEIPAPFGPWKISGLPGLVMKAADTDNVHVFEAISFRKGDMPVYRPGWPDAEKIDRKKFIERKVDFENSEDPLNKVPHESIREMGVLKSAVGSGSVFVVNGIPIRKKDNGYIPRELR